MKVSIDDVILRQESVFQYAKANHVCTGFNEFVLPPGCEPPLSRIAFDWQGDTRLLMIDQGIRYPGSHKAFREFVQNGVFRGNTPEEIAAFLTDIKSAYGSAPNTPSARSTAPQQPVSPPSPRLDSVVDTSRIIVEKPQSRKLDDKALLADLQAEVRGQDQALEGAVNVVNTHTSKRKPKRPAAMLFAGPSGTGKTMTAELLPPLLTKHTGKEWGYIRVDMNQMGEAHTVSRLVGAPPVYVGHDDTPLFAPLQTNPRQVIHFDEMEKGHPKVLQVLMNVMANGRLEASKVARDGTREFDFCEAILIFTSNLPLSVENPGAMTQAEITRICRKQLIQTGGMPPEIAARFTEILLFRALSEQDKVDILALSMIRLGEQYGLNVQHISTGLLQNVVDNLSVENGAREPQYILESLLGAAFAAFADEHDTRDVSLAGTTEHVEITPFNAAS